MPTHPPARPDRRHERAHTVPAAAPRWSPPALLTIDDVARRIVSSDRHVRRLIKRGELPAHGLADLVRPGNLRETLRFFLERAGNRSTRQIHELAAAALAIARHRVRVDDAQEQKLRASPAAAIQVLTGMTEKNRAVLRRLEDQRLRPDPARPAGPARPRPRSQART